MFPIPTNKSLASVVVGRRAGQLRRTLGRAGKGAFPILRTKLAGGKSAV